jgi:hypothetical protein
VHHRTRKIPAEKSVTGWDIAASLKFEGITIEPDVWHLSHSTSGFPTRCSKSTPS